MRGAGEALWQNDNRRWRAQAVQKSRGDARKRRLVLRQMASPGANDSLETVEAEPVNHAADIHAFAADCSAQLPLRLQVTDERSGENEEVLVDRPFALIGSSETADVRLIHPDVSRNHAYLQIIEGRVLCCDLASRTGTHWGEEIRSRGWMDVGDVIFVGPFSLRLVDNEFVDPPSDEMPIAMVQAPRVRVRQPNMLLTFLNARSRSGNSRVSRLHSPVTLVGWSHLCQLRLQHRSVGRVHCSLVWTPEGLWVVDLMCRGGTRVNRDWVSFARLDDRDEMEMGRFHLKVTYGSSGEFPILEELQSTVSPITANEMDLDETSPSSIVRSKSAVSELRDPKIVESTVTRVAPRADLARPTVSIPTPVTDDRSTDMAVGDTTAVSLMKQFAAMQQQMFDHTYQLLAVVTNAFQTAHNRQMELIREELMRVHDLNRELYELNRQRGTPETAQAPPIGGDVPIGPALDGLQRPLFPPAIAQAFQHPAAAFAATAGGVEAASAIPAAPPRAITKEAPIDRPTATAESSPPPLVNGSPAVSTAGPTEAQQPNGHRDAPPHSRRRYAKQNGGDRPAASRAAPDAAIEHGAAPKVDSPTDTAAPEQDVHAWLSGRINELTQERSSRWQRILQLLTSGG